MTTWRYPDTNWNSGVLKTALVSISGELAFQTIARSSVLTYCSTSLASSDEWRMDGIATKPQVAAAARWLGG